LKSKIETESEKNNLILKQLNESLSNNHTLNEKLKIFNNENNKLSSEIDNIKEIKDK